MKEVCIPARRVYEWFWAARGAGTEELGGSLHSDPNSNEEIHQAMTKSLEVIIEAIPDPKHPFRKVDNQPNKPRNIATKRRKIRSYLHLGEWVSGEAA